MFSDSLNQSYVSVYDSIGEYRDYSKYYKTDTIKSMVHLRLIIHRLDTMLNNDPKSHIGEHKSAPPSLQDFLL